MNQQNSKLNTIDSDMNYHPSSTIYTANFDGSEFEKYKMNEYNKLSEDACFNQRKDNDNNKKLKFVTTNHIDLLTAKDKLNFFGIGIKDTLFVPGEQIDNYSDLLNGKTGGQITNCNVKNGFGPLPMLTTPYMGQSQHGDVIIEDSIRNYIEPKKKSDLPKDNEFQDRSFAIFNTNIESPQAIKSVETPQIGFLLGRHGQSTRYVNKFGSKKYSSSGEKYVEWNKWKYL